MSTVKILVCGDVRGRIAELYRRVTIVNDKHGPFSALFCVGCFLDVEPLKLGNDSDGAVDDDSRAFLDGTVSVPVPTFVVPGEDVDHPFVSSRLTRDGGNMAPGIRVLGCNGVTEIDGLVVAFLSGRRQDWYYGAKDVAELGNRVRELGVLSGIVDLLLTPDWPLGVSKHSDRMLLPDPVRSKEDTPNPVGCSHVAKAAKELRPRYHFASTQGVFYQRVPFVESQHGYATRFLGLGAVGGDAKFLHALSLSPCRTMSSVALKQKPDGATASPFEDDVLPTTTATFVPRPPPGPPPPMRPWSQQNGTTTMPTMGPGTAPFFPHVAPLSGQPTSSKRRRMDNGTAPAPCWFCLGSPQVERHLIVSVGTEVYLALPKGGLVPQHVLIIPIEHEPSMVRASSGVRAELQSLKLALRQYFARAGSGVVIFERYAEATTSQHGHLQVIPVPFDKTELIGNRLIDDGRKCGLAFTLRNDVDLSGDAAAVVVGKGSYHTVEIYGLDAQTPTVLVNVVEQGARFQLQFVRDVCAKALGAPERSNWKLCQLSKDEETAEALALRKAFAPFDPST